VLVKFVSGICDNSFTVNVFCVAMSPVITIRLCGGSPEGKRLVVCDVNLVK